MEKCNYVRRCKIGIIKNCSRDDMKKCEILGFDGAIKKADRILRNCNKYNNKIIAMFPMYNAIKRRKRN